MLMYCDYLCMESKVRWAVGNRVTNKFLNGSGNRVTDLQPNNIDNIFI